MGPVAEIPSRRWTKKHLILGAGAAVLIVGLAVGWWHTELRMAVDAVVLGLREAGPAVFFVAMALLPAVGFPLLAFTLAAGPVFGPTLGTGWVIGWSTLAVVVNLLLTYWLANRALRPLVSRLLFHFGFPLPESRADGAWQTTLIVRLVPGPPYWVQSYLLGLIRVPLVPYLIVSTFIMAGYIVALVLGGEAVVNGNGRMAFVAIGVLVVFVAGLQLMRKLAAGRRAPASVPLDQRQTVTAR